jgi:hypothetical protein
MQKIEISDADILGFLNAPITCPSCNRKVPEETYFVDCEYYQCCEKCGHCIEDPIERNLTNDYLFSNYSYCLKKKIVYKKKNYLNKVLKEKEIPLDLRMHIRQIFNVFEEIYYIKNDFTKRRYFINYNYFIRKILNLLHKLGNKYYYNNKCLNLKNIRNRFKKIKKRSLKQNYNIYYSLYNNISVFYPNGIKLSFDEFM